MNLGAFYGRFIIGCYGWMAPEADLVKYRADRRLTDREITLHSDGSARQVTLRDVSVTGMKARTSTPFEVGMTVYVMLASKERSATVVWSRGVYVGFEFDTPLTPAELAGIHRPEGISQASRQRWTAPGRVHGFRELN